MVIFRILRTFAFVLLASGCASQPAELSPGPDHPASAEAAEAPLPQIGRVLQSEATPHVPATREPTVPQHEHDHAPASEPAPTPAPAHEHDDPQPPADAHHHQH